MDDTLKIKVLMIYYDHWGKDEINARKVVYGINKTKELLSGQYAVNGRTLEDGLRRIFLYLCNEETYYLWIEFVDVLLQDYGGCFDYDKDGEYYYEGDFIFDRKMLLEDHLEGLFCSETEFYDILYDHHFSANDILSVDAIVALR